MKRNLEQIIDHLELIVNVKREDLQLLTVRQIIYLYHRTEHEEIPYMTLQELADEFGSSRQAVDQLYKRGLKRLGTLDSIKEKRLTISQGVDKMH